MHSENLTTVSLFFCPSFQDVRFYLDGHFLFSAYHLNLIILIQVYIFGGAWRGLRCVIVRQAFNLSLGFLRLIYTDAKK